LESHDSVDFTIKAGSIECGRAVSLVDHNYLDLAEIMGEAVFARKEFDVEIVFLSG